jgi:hypothetical protein
MDRYSKGLLTSMAFSLCAFFCTPQSFAADPAKRQTNTTDYLREMPSAERVMADFRGEGLLNTDLDTAKRQIAALMRLITMITVQQEGGEFVGKPTAEEQTLKGSYYQAINAIKSDQNFGEGQRKQLHIYHQDQQLLGNKKIEKEVLERYFSPAWQAKYLGITMTLAEQNAMIHTKEARANEAMKAQLKAKHPGVNIPILLLGIIGTVVGFSGLIWCSKRAFHRTNQYGVQEFKSYGSLFLSHGVENLVVNLSYFILAAGIGAIMFSFWDILMQPKG